VIFLHSCCPSGAEIREPLPKESFLSGQHGFCADFLHRKPALCRLIHAPCPAASGGSANRAMRSRMAANSRRGTVTSASWNVTYLECRVTLAPILMSLSRSVVSDQCCTGFGNANRRRKLSRLRSHVLWSAVKRRCHYTAEPVFPGHLAGTGESGKTKTRWWRALFTRWIVSWLPKN
jgi:hypothetical protein